MVIIPIDNLRITRYVPRYSPEQYHAWNEMAKTMTKEPDIVAFTGWSKGGRGYSPARFTVRGWSNVPAGMEPYSVHLEFNNNIPFNFFHNSFKNAITFDEAITELKRQLNFNQQSTKPRSPNRMKNEIIQ